MGIWNTSLYSSDFTLDLRSAINAVLRLPFDPDGLVDVLCHMEPTAANSPDNEEYTTFWLVVADQFAKRGILSDRARDTALSVIDNGTDLAVLKRLGMTASDLAKRAETIEAVRTRIVTAQPAAKARSVLKKPQPLLMDIGDVFAYPTSAGRAINPYIRPGQERTIGPLAWTHDGWSAFVVIDRGRAFDFLAWYRPLTVVGRATSGKPRLEELCGSVQWTFRLAGTCSQVHFKRMRLEKIGKLPVNCENVRRVFPDMQPGHPQAISDISICNHLSVGPAVQDLALAASDEPNHARRAQQQTISDIGQLLDEAG